MAEKWEQAFDEIVFAVAKLVFGDSLAVQAAYQNIVRLALITLDVPEILIGLQGSGLTTQ